MTYQELESKTIDFLRFPLIIGVIFIHNYSSTMTVQGVEMGNDTFMPAYHIASELFSQVIGRVAVPLFFLISGFLFFLRVDFDKTSYLRKLRSRSKSLLVPYLAWNVAFLAFYYTVSHLPVLRDWFKGAEYTAEFILTSLWGRAGNNPLDPMTYPIAYQFWFIRDLMVTVLLTPLIYAIIKHLKGYGPLLFGLLWFFQCWPNCLQYHGLSITAWFFFMTGAWLSISRKNMVETFRKAARPTYILYPILAVADLCSKDLPGNSYIHNAGIIAGILFFFNLASHYIGKGIWKTSALLSGASFFVFAIHDPWLLSQLKKVAFKVFRPDTDGQLTLLYFAIPICVAGIALGIYMLLRKFAPTFLKIICGR